MNGPDTQTQNDALVRTPLAKLTNAPQTNRQAARQQKKRVCIFGLCKFIIANANTHRQTHSRDPTTKKTNTRRQNRVYGKCRNLNCYVFVHRIKSRSTRNIFSGTSLPVPLAVFGTIERAASLAIGARWHSLGYAVCSSAAKHACLRDMFLVQTRRYAESN